MNAPTLPALHFGGPHIALFVLDLDGCTTEPFKSPDWAAFTQLREWNIASRTDNTIPPLTLCTGRPQPYAEAIAQLLDIRHPLLFESGAGAYDPVNVAFHWSPLVEEHRLTHVRRVMQWMEHELTKRHPGSYMEFTKRTDAGIVHSDPELIPVIKAEIVTYIEKHALELDIHHTPISIDVLMKGINKGTGLRWISEWFNVPLRHIAYIGDSSGDIEALKIAGHPFAPANAADSVKQLATVTSKSFTNGVVEAYERIILRNRNSLAYHQTGTEGFLYTGKSTDSVINTSDSAASN
jgi:HAD superfamily hydrolase (TIGR01484 family)